MADFSGWLADWVAGWLTGWLAGRLAGWLVEGRSGSLALRAAHPCRHQHRVLGLQPPADGLNQLQPQPVPADAGVNGLSGRGCRPPLVLLGDLSSLGVRWHFEGSAD